MIDLDLSKYDQSVIRNIDKENTNKIIEFLIDNNCDYIEELLEDYLDIFTFEYDEFTDKYNKLNSKYNDNLIEEIREDMNILEELYTIE